MFQIKTYDQIAAVGLNNFGHDRYEVASALNDPDAIILRSCKLHDEPLSDSLKAIARAGAGVNNVPVKNVPRGGLSYLIHREPMLMRLRNWYSLRCCSVREAP